MFGQKTMDMNVGENRMAKDYGEIETIEELKNKVFTNDSSIGALEMKFNLLLQKLEEEGITSESEIDEGFQNMIEDA